MKRLPMSRCKILFSLTLSLALGTAHGLAAVASPNQPHGGLLELHSCELFAGSCVVSSEANVAGNYVLRVWQFDGGQVQGVALRGLSVALLEAGDENLAVPENAAQSAVVYLPKGLSPAQRSVLIAWAGRSTQVKLDDAHVKVAPLQTELTQGRVSFSAGRDITFDGGTPALCNVGGCGEMLWYEPRGETSSFVVDQLDRSRIVEPLLAVKWMDHGRRTLFVGRFGDPAPSVPAICGAPVTASL
jgi:hypothetical protein